MQVFLLRTSNVFISNITHIVVNQKYFKTFLSLYLGLPLE